MYLVPCTLTHLSTVCVGVKSAIRSAGVGIGGYAFAFTAFPVWHVLQEIHALPTLYMHHKPPTWIWACCAWVGAWDRPSHLGLIWDFCMKMLGLWLNWCIMLRPLWMNLKCFSCLTCGALCGVQFSNYPFGIDIVIVHTTTPKR